MSVAVFYHAGCPVCLGAEQMVADAIDHAKYDVEIVHLGDQSERITEAKTAGVKSVPALVLNDQVFHINFGASIDDLA
ncbi:MAG: thioredoxin family protein [Methylovulum sp.]|nr:thioredoxin family protein [Methylovulum sp.]